VLELEHYLDALTRKPGALAGSTALEQCRAQGRWPASYDRCWELMKEREGKRAGTRAMIDVLLLGREHGAARVRQAVVAEPGGKIATGYRGEHHRFPPFFTAAAMQL
jgi:hypothetical protein